MNITLIYAECRGVIAIDGELPVHLPEDLKHFKSYTLGKVLVMGRKTLESLPKKLEGRTVICLTSDKDYEDTRADLVMNSKKEMLEWAEDQELEELVIAGGGDVYKLFMKECNKIVKTRINHTLVLKADFKKMKNKLLSPDMKIKGEFSSAEVLMKTNKMVVVAYTWDSPWLPTD